LPYELEYVSIVHETHESQWQAAIFELNLSVMADGNIEHILGL